MRQGAHYPLIGVNIAPFCPHSQHIKEREKKSGASFVDRIPERGTRAATLLAAKKKRGEEQISVVLLQE
jgi:hypothetical protein